MISKSRNFIILLGLLSAVGCSTQSRSLAGSHEDVQGEEKVHEQTDKTNFEARGKRFTRYQK